MKTNFVSILKSCLKNLRLKVYSKLDVFTQNPFHPRLKNHALHGQLKHLRAFSVTSDIRIIFEELDNYAIVLMLDIGSHNSVY